MRQDPSPRRVGQSSESAIQRARRIVNHVVKYSARDPFGCKFKFSCCFLSQNRKEHRINAYRKIERLIATFPVAVYAAPSDSFTQERAEETHQARLQR